MKFILILFLIIQQFFGYAQNDIEFKLSKTIDESRMGYWINGDYKVYVEMKIIEQNCRDEHKSLIQTIQSQPKTDTANIPYYQFAADRYLIAANQLKEAKNGFDLKSLVIYHGPNKKENNIGYSYAVLLLIRHQVEKGNALVYYKGERIFSLKVNVKSDDYSRSVKIYYDQIDNCVFTDFEHFGW
jgi:hypothetical protein